MNPRMYLSRRGANFIKGWEKCRLDAYQDDKGVWTVGWGHTGSDINEDTRWSQQRADHEFLWDVQWAEDAVNDYVMVSLTQAQFDALVSLVFNIGKAAFFGSTLLASLNRSDYLDARNQFLVWVKETFNGKKRINNGLVRRRNAEALLFETP